MTVIDTEVRELNVKEMNIYERMNRVTSELGLVFKDLQVSTGKNKPSYSAVSDRDVLDAVKPLEEKYRIYSYAVQREIISEKEMTTSNGYIQQFMRLEIVYRFVNIDKPSEYVDIKSYGDGLDGGDKSVGKAMTYADKYALMKAYKISTGDDPDKEASGDYKTSTQATASEGQVKYIKSLYTEDEIKRSLDRVNKKDLSELTIQEASKMIEFKKQKE